MIVCGYDIKKDGWRRQRKKKSKADFFKRGMKKTEGLKIENWKKNKSLRFGWLRLMTSDEMTKREGCFVQVKKKPRRKSRKNKEVEEMKKGQKGGCAE